MRPRVTKPAGRAPAAAQIAWPDDRACGRSTGAGAAGADAAAGGRHLGGRLLHAKQLRQRCAVLRLADRTGAVMRAALDQHELLGHRGRLVELAAQGRVDQAVGRAVHHQQRRADVLDLADRLEALGDEGAEGQPAPLEAAHHVGDGGEGALDDGAALVVDRARPGRCRSRRPASGRRCSAAAWGAVPRARSMRRARLRGPSLPRAGPCCSCRSRGSRWPAPRSPARACAACAAPSRPRCSARHAGRAERACRPIQARRRARGRAGGPAGR